MKVEPMKTTLPIIAAALFMGTAATAGNVGKLTDCYLDAMLIWQGIDRVMYDAVLLDKDSEPYAAVLTMRRSITNAAVMSSSAMDQGHGVAVIAFAMSDAFPAATVADMTACNMEYLR